MSHLGPWQPTTADERLDRLESLAEIQQLAVRYALALDSRDMDMMVSLFTPDVRVGREERGRDALRAWFVKTLSEPSPSQPTLVSVHFVGNHIVDFDDADHARGIVYCHDELGRPNGGWDEGMLQYWDTYVRVDSPEGREWCFDRRKFLRWYMVDALERPAHGAGVGADHDALTTSQLPDAFESWQRFWDEVGVDPLSSSR
jgi:hypothetical protein